MGGRRDDVSRCGPVWLAAQPSPIPHDSRIRPRRCFSIKITRHVEVHPIVALAHQVARGGGRGRPHSAARPLTLLPAILPTLILPTRILPALVPTARVLDLRIGDGEPADQPPKTDPLLLALSLPVAPPPWRVRELNTPAGPCSGPVPAVAVARVASR